MKTYQYLNEVHDLVDAHVNPSEIAGYAGFTTAVINTLLTEGRLPPPIDEPGKFFFAPTVAYVKKLLGEPVALAYDEHYKIEGGADKEAIVISQSYAAHKDSCRYLAEILGLEKLPFLNPTVHIDSYDGFSTLRQYYQNETGIGPGTLYYELTQQKGYTEAEVENLIIESQKRRGIVLTVKSKIFELMDGREMKGLNEGMTNGFYVEVDQKKGLDIEYFSSISPQCEYSRARLRMLLGD